MSLTVPYLNLQAQFCDDDLMGVVREQFERCQFVMGPEVEEFEKGFASICGAPYALGVNSGTDALFLALKAVGVGAGDEVPEVLRSLGYEVVLLNDNALEAGSIYHWTLRPLWSYCPSWR